MIVFFICKGKEAEMAKDVNKDVDPDGSKDNPNPDGGGEEKPILYDEKFVKELQTETIQRRKQIEKLEAQIKANEDAKLTDNEKDKKRIVELEKKLVDNEVNTNQAKTDSLIVEAISDKNIIDKTVFKLLVKSELESEEEINDKVIVKIVDKLIKDKPYLISSGTVIPSDGNFPKKDEGIAKDPNKMFGDFLRDQE